jgi:hypothetical protein
MLGETVGQLFQGEPDILEGNLLADHQEGHGREVFVQAAQHAGQHGAVAHARIVQAKRRRAGLDLGQLLAHPFGDGPLLAAGGDELQILLAVVEKTEMGFGRRGCLSHVPAAPSGNWNGS